jgi:hypothetical protein
MQLGGLKRPPLGDFDREHEENPTSPYRRGRPPSETRELTQCRDQHDHHNDRSHGYCGRQDLAQPDAKAFLCPFRLTPFFLCHGPTPLRATGYGALRGVAEHRENCRSGHPSRTVRFSGDLFGEFRGARAVLAETPRNGARRRWTSLPSGWLRMRPSIFAALPSRDVGGWVHAVPAGQQHTHDG